MEPHLHTAAHAAPKPSRLARAYVAVVTAAGLTALALLLVEAPPGDAPWPVVTALGLAVVLAELFPVRMSRSAGETTSTTAFTMALLLMGGPAAAAVAQAGSCLAADLRERKPADRLAFNVGQYALAVAAAWAVLETTTTLGRPFAPDLADLPGLVAAGAVFFVVNEVVVAIAIALHDRAPLRAQLRAALVFHTASEALLLGLAPLVVVVLDRSPVLAPLVLLPFLAIHRAGRHAVERERTAALDALTGLPNRSVLHERAQEAIDAADGAFVAVMLLDLDRFKEINDTLGHAAGDAVLRELGGRLASTVGPADTVARLGGDEFAVLVRSAPGPHEAATLAERLRNAVLPPVEVDAVRLSLDVSIGLAWSPDHGTDVETLVQRADVAMYQAKAAGGGVHAYAADRDAHSLERLAIAQDLRGAVESGEVRVHFQPQVDLRDGTVAGVEALARWTHPLLGVIPPSDFIPVAEETGVIGALTDHVLDEAIARGGAWRRQGLELTIAVNLSARTIADETLPTRIAAMCARHGLAPELLVCEITESMVFHDPVAAAATLERIADLGCTISIDDFGTGYSSLENLKRLPIGEVKVDRSFVAGLDGDERDRAIVRGTLELAHALGMRVVAEGVEHDGMLAELEGMGCELGQGWLWARPLAPEDLPAAVARIAASRRLRRRATA